MSPPRRIGKYERLARERNERDLALTRQSGGHPRGLWFNDAEADRAVDFIQGFCRHYKGEWVGQPLRLEEWARWVVRCIFGWMRADGTRRFRTAWEEIARKNGKTTKAAGGALYMLAGDGEPGAEVYCLDPSTRVLDGEFRWRPIGDFSVGDPLVAFDEELPGPRKYRKLRAATVTSVERLIRPCYRIRLTDGREVIASAEHRWLSIGPNSIRRIWLETERMKPGSRIRDLGRPWEEDRTWAAGYLAGVFDGEACFMQRRRLPDGSAQNDGFRLCFAQKPGRVMDLTRELCGTYGFDPSPLRKHVGGVDTFEVAGFYNCARFLGQISPRRLVAGGLAWCSGKTPNRASRCAVVESSEFIGDREVVALGTSTRTFFAEGLFSHNCTATKEKQAWILHDDATNMVEHSADLRQVVAIARHNLSCERLGSKFEPLGADSDTLDGLNPHAHFPDEVHAHKDPGVWIKLDTAMGSRRQPLTWAITTAGVYDKESVGWQKHQYAVDVLEGTVDDDEFFAFICALDEDDDAFDPANWGKANPNLGVSIYESFMHGQAKKAQHDPSFFNDYLQLHHNRWTQQAKRWILPAKWAALHEGPPAMRSEWEAPLAGRSCFGGLDLSSKIDLTALVFAFRGSDDMIDLVCRFWIPEARVEEEAKKKRKHYQQWVEAGWLIATPGQRVDYEFIRKEINELGQKFRIEQIAFDPWNAGSIVAQLQDTDGFMMVETRQGFASLSDPSKDFAARIEARQIRHGGHPILAWNVGNAVTTSDPAGNIKPDKSKAKDKIDGVIAAIMALGRANLREESAYSGERGFQSL